MKRLMILAIAMTGTIALTAQSYVGVKGHYANTWILNQNISDAGDELDYKGSYTGGFGLHGIHMFSEQSGIGLGFGISRHKQQTQGKFGNETYVGETKMKYTDLSLLYSYQSLGGFYLEVGPQFSFRRDVIEETTDLDGVDEVTHSFVDKNLNNSTVFGVFGIGGRINLNEELKLMVGIQFGYGITDLTNELSETEYSESSFDEDFSFHTDEAQGYAVDDEGEVSFDYKPTNPAFARFNLGLYYTID